MPRVERSAQVSWEGNLARGEGRISAPSGVLSDAPYSAATRIAARPETTSPEELLAAAHAGCFAMALSHGLAQEGHAPERLETSATITFVPGTGITKSVLTVTATDPGVEEDAFRQAAEAAKDGCPVSSALHGN